MTNREWLATLTNEELSRWMTEQASEIVGWKTIYQVGTPKQLAQFDNLYPRLEEIKRAYSFATGGVEKWLGEEHYE